VEVRGVDQVEACQEFLRLGERTVGNRQLAATDAHGLRCANWLQRLGGNIASALAERVSPADALVIGYGLQLLLFGVNQTDELHGLLRIEWSTRFVVRSDGRHDHRASRSITRMPHC